MTFDFTGAKAESDAVEGAVADFRRDCTDAGVALVESSSIMFGAGRWGLVGDFAGMVRTMREVPTTHVFLGGERYDFENDVAESAARSNLDVQALKAATLELRVLDGLAMNVRAMASFAGVPFSASETAAWKSKANETMANAVKKLLQGGHSYGRKDGDAPVRGETTSGASPARLPQVAASQAPEVEARQVEAPQVEAPQVEVGPRDMKAAGEMEEVMMHRSDEPKRKFFGLRRSG